MSTARQRRGFAGVTKLRKTLRRFDESLTRDIKVELEAGAQAIERDMIGGAPVDEADLVNSIGYKMGRDGFTAVIGPAADSAQIKSGFGVVNEKFTKAGNLTAATVRNKTARMQLYKALWAEFGTKAGEPGSSSKPARPFIQPAYDANKDRLTERIRAAVDRALKEAASG